MEGFENDLQKCHLSCGELPEEFEKVITIVEEKSKDEGAGTTFNATSTLALGAPKAAKVRGLFMLLSLRN